MKNGNGQLIESGRPASNPLEGPLLAHSLLHVSGRNLQMPFDRQDLGKNPPPMQISARHTVLTSILNWFGIQNVGQVGESAREPSFSTYTFTFQFRKAWPF